jgi:cation-transporting P-type ATPase E
VPFSSARKWSAVAFASLAPAVEEGQRIRNGMQDILRLFLSRIMTVGLLIVTSLVIGIFPIALRNGFRQ